MLKIQQGPNTFKVDIGDANNYRGCKAVEYWVCRCNDYPNNIQPTTLGTCGKCTTIMEGSRTAYVEEALDAMHTDKTAQREENAVLIKEYYMDNGNCG